MNDQKAKYSSEPLISIIGGIFFVCFLWGIWTKGIYALGLNATVFSLGVLYLSGKASSAKTLFDKTNLYWALPIALMAIAFFLYENPFFKIIHLIAFPTLATAAFALFRISNPDRAPWACRLIARALLGSFEKLGKSLSASGVELKNYVSGRIPFNYGTSARVLQGILILLALLVAILPLLQSVDPVFAMRFEWITFRLLEIFKMTAIFKVITGIAVAVLILAALISWRSSITYRFSDQNQPTDSIVAGIVLGGVLMVYLLFLSIQVERLWVASLPLEFQQTEYYVKSGFWQLVLLSLINISLFLAYYKKTTKVAQGLLSVFSVASILLVASAAHRITLYVIYYGFSYEKFYAFYTVVFCAALISMLTYASFQRDRKDVVRWAFSLLLWAYSAVSVFPVEHFVLTSTVVMSKIAGSRADLNELRMLSTDVLPLVLEYRKAAIFTNKGKDGPFYSRYESCNGSAGSWSRWICEKDHETLSKQWYELTLLNITYQLSR